MQLEFRTDDNYRTSGVVDALPEQVLTEATLLALEHVAERLERALAPTTDRFRTTPVVEECVNGLLQHALLVAENDLRGAHVDEFLETIVPVDDPTIQIVQIGCRETTTIEGHEWTQVRRNDRNHIQNHPLRLITLIRGLARSTERIHDLKPLQLLLLTMLGGLVEDLVPEPLSETVQAATISIAILDLLLIRVVEHPEERACRFRTDLRLEPLITLFPSLHTQVVELVFVQKLLELDFLLAGIRNDIRGIVDDLLEVTQGHSEQVTQLARERLEEPDVRNRHSQLDVAHAFAADLGQRDFNPASVADVPAEPYALELSAVALPVLHRPEDTLTEEPIPLRLEGTVVDRLRLDYLAEGP